MISLHVVELLLLRDRVLSYMVNMPGEVNQRQYEIRVTNRQTAQSLYTHSK